MSIGRLNVGGEFPTMNYRQADTVWSGEWRVTSKVCCLFNLLIFDL